MNSTMFCTECGKKIPADSRFCPECGAKVEPLSYTVASNSAASNSAISNSAASNSAASSQAASSPVASNPVASSAVESSPVASNPVASSAVENGPVASNPAVSNQVASSPIASKSYETGQSYGDEMTPEERKKMKKILAISGAVVAALVAVGLIILLLSVLIKPSIKLNDYMTVSTEGIDQYGRAVAEFDRQQFNEDYGKKLNKTNKNKNSKKNKKSKKGKLSLFSKAFGDDYDSYYDDYYESGTASFMDECVSWSFDKDSYLSNGDIITLQWDCNPEVALEKYGYKLKYKEISLEVTDLPEAGKFDPFDGLEVTFEGIGPDGRASIMNYPDMPETEDFRYFLDKTDGLSNGDTVKVSITSYDDNNDLLIQRCAEQFGKIPSELEKTYTVKGLSKYVENMSEISDDCINEMRKTAEDYLETNTANYFDESEKRLGTAYIGNFFLTNKNPDNGYASNNMLCLVYKTRIKDEYSDKKNKFVVENNFYWYMCFYDILVDPDGKNTVNLDNYFLPSNTVYVDSGISAGWFSTYSWSYSGFYSLGDLYREIVINNQDSFNCVDNVDENLAPVEIFGPIIETGIIFPTSSEEIIDSELLEELTDEELVFAENEIYARNGFIFEDEAMRDYYRNFHWYKETVPASEFTGDYFNETEKKNIDAMEAEKAKRQ